jgi:hypothetical protein
MWKFSEKKYACRSSRRDRHEVQRKMKGSRKGHAREEFPSEGAAGKTCSERIVDAFLVQFREARG